MNMRYSSLFSTAREKKDCPGECAEIIRKAEAHAGHSQDWCLCAKAWLKNLNDTDNAARCLLEAECRFYRNCRELAICAGGWLDLLNNLEGAKRCIEKITHTASNAEDWDYCADFMAKAGIGHLAGFCLLQAEKYAHTHKEWQERADMWRDMLHDEANSHRCAENAMRSDGQEDHFIIGNIVKTEILMEDDDKNRSDPITIYIRPKYESYKDDDNYPEGDDCDDPDKTDPIGFLQGVDIDFIEVMPGEYFEIPGDMVGSIGTEGVELELSTTELMEDFDEESPLPSGRYLYDGAVVKKVDAD